VAEANTLAYKAGYHFGETAELFESCLRDPRRHFTSPALTRTSPATAPSRGGSSRRPGSATCRSFLGSYPITPASDILHELSKHKNFGRPHAAGRGRDRRDRGRPRAAFGGALGVTTTSGPGIDLKSETVGLAVSMELPLLIVDIQRGGPSTGLPTKTEQSDLLHAMFGRHGEAPVPIVAAMTPAHCFDAAIEAVRIALKYRTPVFLLSDGYLANGSEPWRLPSVEDLPDISNAARDGAQRHAPERRGGFLALRERSETLARPMGNPWHSRPGAQDRGAREARPDGQRLLRAGEPRQDGPLKGGEDRRDRQGQSHR